jgi:hypothetical protein
MGDIEGMKSTLMRMVSFPRPVFDPNEDDQTNNWATEDDSIFEDELSDLHRARYFIA